MKKFFSLDILQQEDATSLCRLMGINQERFRRYFPNTLGQNLTVQASKTYIALKAEEMRSKSQFTYVIRILPKREIAGLVILKEIDWNKKTGELAYCIGKEFENKGWMTMAVSQFSKFALEDLKLKTLQIIVHVTNKGSIRVAEKCGYLWKKTLNKAYTPPDEIALNMELYELSI